MIVFVVPSESEAAAVTPTVVVAAEFSATVFAALLESVGVDTSASSTSVNVTVNVVAAVLESALVAVICTVHSLSVATS